MVKEEDFPLSFATALFSFLYHLATYEASKFFACGRGAVSLASGWCSNELGWMGWKRGRWEEVARRCKWKRWRVGAELREG